MILEDDAREQIRNKILEATGFVSGDWVNLLFSIFQTRATWRNTVDSAMLN